MFFERWHSLSDQIISGLFTINFQHSIIGNHAEKEKQTHSKEWQVTETDSGDWGNRAVWLGIES